MRFRPVLVASAAVVSLLAGLLSAGPVASAATAVGVAGVRADDGAYVTSETAVASGVVDLTISSPALRGTSRTNGTTKVRLFLPSRWASAPSTKWPTLYLFHGANDAREYTSWDLSTPVRSFMAGKDVLTVMPSAGQSGFFTNEQNYGLGGGMNWETFHTLELPQLLERGYRSSGVRAVAGVSMGGFGSLSYAARHPGMYKFAASYSGVVDTLAPTVPLVVVGVVRMRDGKDPFSLWGDPLFGRATWAAHNPADLVAKLKGTSLYVSTGDGLNGTVDAPDVLAQTPIDIIEYYSKIDYDSFVAKAKKANVPVTAHYVPGGAHYWTFWTTEFERSWPQMSAALGLTGQGRLKS